MHDFPPFHLSAVTPRLLAGRNPLTTADVSQLRQRGVTHVLDLRQAREWAAPGRIGEEAIRSLERSGIARLNVPVEDAGAPAMEDLDRSVDFIQRAFLQGETRVYVHCRAGIERTGAVVAAWWAWEHGTSLAETLRTLAGGGSKFSPLSGQRDAVRRWLRSPRPGRAPSLCSRIRGSLLGGAAGDALGAPVEFLSLGAIREKFGRAGIRAYAPAYGRPVAITDDTQMTLFTIEGLIRASVRGRSKGICHPPSVLERAYWRWLFTQGERPEEEQPIVKRSGTPNWADGWFVRHQSLRHRRAPGNSCLSALRSGRFGTPEEPINDSKGCGAVMRGAPVGFVDFAAGDEMFKLGCEIGAVTHGHPTGYCAAGALAVIVEQLRGGQGLGQAVAAALVHLQNPRFVETRRALEGAVALAAQGEPSAEKVESLGGGWVGEEALAIAVYTALAAPDFEAALVLAVNHGGDSDSTGALCGSLLGARDGVFAIPPRFLDKLEAKALMGALADDFALELTDPPRDPAGGGASRAWFERYPGW